MTASQAYPESFGMVVGNLLANRYMIQSKDAFWIRDLGLRMVREDLEMLHQSRSFDNCYALT